MSNLPRSETKAITGLDILKLTAPLDHILSSTEKNANSSPSSPFFVAIDAQVSEVGKMLYQQGLTELIHSSCSEQVAYLLVERASLLEMSDTPDKLTCDGNTTSPQGTERRPPNSNACQVRGRT